MDKKVLVLLVAALTLSFTCLAWDTSPTFEVPCRAKGEEFKIKFVSKSGHVSEDDMTVTIEQAGTSTPVSVKPAWFHRRGLVSALKSVCEGIPAIEVIGGNVLIILTPDDRPSFDRTSLVLYSPKTKKVIQVKESIGEFKACSEQTHYAMRSRGPNRVQVRLIREWLKDTSSDGAEVAIEDWMTISISKTYLKTEWQEK